MYLSSSAVGNPAPGAHLSAFLMSSVKHTLLLKKEKKYFFKISGKLCSKNQISS